MPYTRRRVAVLVAILAALTALVSCTVNQTIVIRNDGSGTLAMHAEVSNLLRDYMSSLAEVSGKTDMMKDGKVFDIATIRKDFSSRPGITVRKVAAPTANSLDLEIGYTSLADVFAGEKTLKGSGALVYSESGGTKTVRLHLDRSNYTQLASLFPLLNDPAVAGIGPQVNDTITDAEYLDMIGFTLGDDGPPLLKKSSLSLTIDPEGQILSQSGGTLNGGAVTFRIPLLRLLVLDKPLDYSVTFN
jgi:hypothetical protein